jgi:hypothetical protein
MFSGKNQASQKPTAFGSMLQASTYGVVIPVPYGRCQTPLYAIWANNLRQGGSTKKFKQDKKGIISYCENIDFLIGKNPILSALQSWNNGAILPLNDEVYTTTATAGSPGVFTVPDSHFYSITAVTLEVAYSETFNDYGSQGAQTLAGTFEVPLWNQLFAGPDPTASTDPRNFPYCYRWNPITDGATIHIDQLAFGALPTGTLRIYYTQKTSATKFQPPISRLRLAFENILGSGDEYDGFAAQQILYPHYAGLGSQEIDLGSTGAIPAIKQEVQAKWGVSKAGDCDFVDIVEDVVKSGITQAALGGGINFGATEHGTGSYNLPGTIQKKLATSNNASGLPAMPYDMPNTQGNILVVSAFGQAALSIASSNAETWHPVFSGTPARQVWWANALGGTNTVTVSGAGQPSEVCIMEIGGVGISNATPSLILGDAVNASGDITKAASCGVCLPYGGGIIWETFVMMSALPADAVVTAIYPVIVADYTFGAMVLLFDAGPGLFFNAVGFLTGGAGGGVTPSPGPGFPTTEFHFGSIGTTIADVIAYRIGADLSGSATLGGEPDAVHISAVGMAIYYTSAEVVSNQPLPPPVAPGPGEQVTWALPTTFTTLDAFGGTSVVNNVASFDPPTVGPPTTTSTAGPFDVQTSAALTPSSSVPTGVAAGWPAYLLAIPFYSAGDSPPSAQVAKWDALTPANFYDKALATFQAHGRIVKNPASYSFKSPGTTATALAMISVSWTDAPQFPQPGGSFINVPSMDLVRAQCRAGGLFGSLSMTAQKAARDWIQDLCDAADCAPVFRGHQLYLEPRSEVSAVGNGAIYVAPTASGPVADLDVDNGDFVTQKGQPAIRATRKSRVGDEIFTVLQMQHVNRASAYQQVTTAEPDAAGIARYGVHKADPTVNDAVQDVAIARSILRILIRRMNYVENMAYDFTLNQRWAPLNAMSLVTITDRSQGIVKVPVRLTSWEEDDKLEIQCEAEPFVYGIHAPQILPATTPAGYSGGGAVNLSAGNVNLPLIFEPVPRLTAMAPQAELWLVISSPATNYGGAQVYVSTDGGASYHPVGDPVIGSAITGELTADWPAAADPDTTNDLAVDLTECLGTLDSYAVVDEDNFVYPCYVQGAPIDIYNNGTLEAEIPLTAILNNNALVVGNFGYELMTYANAVLTAAHKYTLKATGSGNHLRRAVFNAPTMTNGCDHPIAARWAFLSPAGTGIAKLNMDPVWVGHQLFFKILSFNEFGSAAQSLTDVPAYTYTPTGVPYL